MADLPLSLGDGLDATLRSVLDVEGKIPRALDALGPIAQRDVVLVGGGEAETTRLGRLGSRLTPVEPWGGRPWGLPDASADAVVSAWSGFRGVDPAEVAEAGRVLRPGGRLLVVHDYGRDDVSRLRGDLAEYASWSHRSGPFLTSGFRIRVLHCFWTFASIDDARSFLVEGFGDDGAAVADGLKRPRLSYNVAVYHRTFGAASSDDEAASGA